MKKYIICASLALAAVGMSSCDDFLNDNRFPLDEQTNNPNYWNNESNVILQCNTLYNNFTGNASGGSTGGLFYFQTLSDDQGGGIGNGFVNFSPTSIVTASSNWNSPYEQIRKINTIIENVQGSSLTEVAKKKYIGIARLMRGLQYFWLVRTYGDVPYYDYVIDPADNAALQLPRTNRDQVMDKVLEDLKYGAENIGNGSKATFSSDMGYAMLADVALWEGTYCKYRQVATTGYAADNTRATKWLNECVAACQYIMSKSYSLSPDYQATYNTPNTLDGNPEVIFYKGYKTGIMTHSLINYLTQTTAIAGISKDAFDAYLFKDGKPLASTTLASPADPKDAGYMKKGVVSGTAANEDEIIGDMLYIGDVLSIRDKRLSMTVDTVICYGTQTEGHTWARYGSSQLNSNTGYTIRKYDNITIPWTYRASGNYTAAPVFWLSVVYLNYAEAKAELGSLTDGDLNNTINKLFARAELPAQTVAGMSAINDPANNMGVSSLLWEIRRCRRCELIMDNGFRFWDMYRWHQLDKLDTKKYPNIKLGANIKNATRKPSNVVGDYINAIPGNDRVYLDRVYLDPIPTGQITLNPNLEQNPLWK